MKKKFILQQLNNINSINLKHGLERIDQGQIQCRIIVYSTRWQENKVNDFHTN